MKKVLFVFGTRPEAIKMCPVILEMRKHTSFIVKVCVTGQHREMLEQVLNVFNVMPEYDMKIMKKYQTLFDINTLILNGLKNILDKEKPDIVLVHGDTTSAFAAALACFYNRIKIGHVEAGLRTYNLSSPYPEEFNRQAIGIMADYHFAPTEKAKDNLLAEGKKAENIFVTGNTAIDSLNITVKNNYFHKELEWAKGSRLILLTAHRRENWGIPLEKMFIAIKRIVNDFEDVKVIYPVHPNSFVQEVAKKLLGNHPQIHIIEPLDVVDFHNFMNHAYLILTDSGGIQEEAPALGKPVLVMRNTTERLEGVEAGTAILVGTDEDNIYSNCSNLLMNNNLYDLMKKAHNPYGDGKASTRICKILLESENFNHE